MPAITATLIVLLAIALLLGAIIGWALRGKRSAGEKAAINIGWQEQLEAQRNEHQRLFDQNKSLMEQNNQYQASNKDSKMRATELSEALKETFERRDELQRQIKEIRSSLEAAVTERDQLQSDMQIRGAEDDVATSALKRKDAEIARLSNELDGWQQRVPPLIDRFRVRNEEATRLAEELATARARIDALDAMVGSEQTRVEPVDADALGDDLDASNEPIQESVAGDSVPEDIDVPAVVGTVEASEPLNDSAIRETRRDNLKTIKGIGPAIEKTLNEMGICRFNQIAEMSEFDIDRIAQKLKGFRSRIYREDWIGQARDLRDLEPGDHL